MQRALSHILLLTLLLTTELCSAWELPYALCVGNQCGILLEGATFMVMNPKKEPLGPFQFWTVSGHNQFNLLLNRSTHILPNWAQRISGGLLSSPWLPTVIDQHALTPEMNNFLPSPTHTLPQITLRNPKLLYEGGCNLPIGQFCITASDPKKYRP